MLHVHQSALSQSTRDWPSLDTTITNETHIFCICIVIGARTPRASFWVGEGRSCHLIHQARVCSVFGHQGAQKYDCISFDIRPNSDTNRTLICFVVYLSTQLLFTKLANWYSSTDDLDLEKACPGSAAKALKSTICKPFGILTPPRYKFIHSLD